MWPSKQTEEKTKQKRGEEEEHKKNKRESNRERNRLKSMKSFTKRLKAYVFREFQPHLYEVYMMYCCYSVLFAMNRTKEKKCWLPPQKEYQRRKKKAAVWKFLHQVSYLRLVPFYTQILRTRSNGKNSLTSRKCYKDFFSSYLVWADCRRNCSTVFLIQGFVNNGSIVQCDLRG